MLAHQGLQDKSRSLPDHQALMVYFSKALQVDYRHVYSGIAVEQTLVNAAGLTVKQTGARFHRDKKSTHTVFQLRLNKQQAKQWVAHYKRHYPKLVREIRHPDSTWLLAILDTRLLHDQVATDWKIASLAAKLLTLKHHTIRAKTLHQLLGKIPEPQKKLAAIETQLQLGQKSLVLTSGRDKLYYTWQINPQGDSYLACLNQLKSALLQRVVGITEQPSLEQRRVQERRPVQSSELNRNTETLPRQPISQQQTESQNNNINQTQSWLN